MSYTFYFDSTRCTGCKTCELACKDYKDLPVHYGYRRIYDYEGGTWTAGADGTYTTDTFAYHVSISCNHCDNPACVHVCPTAAIHKDKETGLVLVDAHRCVGCGYCNMACPYDAPRVDRDLGHTVKCDGCIERVKEGKNPMCVDACPLRALEFGDAEELMKKHKEAVPGEIAPLPKFEYTIPNLLIKPCPSAKPAGDLSGRVLNLKEVE